MTSDRTYRLFRTLDGNPVTDRRKRPSRPSKYRGYKHQPTAFEVRNIIAWDGEGVSLEDGSHIYTLLANSRGRYIANQAGLTTRECFEFLLRSQRGEKKPINVVYGGSYDVNMMLGTVPPTKIRKLWTTGMCYWQQYGIWYAHRKKLTIAEYRRECGPKPVRKMILWDVLGYFQSTFVKACRKWLGDTFAGRLTIFDAIEEMKNKRGTFRDVDFEAILKYNGAELQLLVMLMKSLFSAMDEAGIVLIRFDGAGSIAASLLRTNNILMHKGKVPREVSEWSQYCYAGGRIEAPQVGNGETTPVWRYDINSAYPYAALDLPSYEGASWYLSDTWDWNDHSMVEVEFNFPRGLPFYPLWVRWPDGSICYPRTGRGRYFGVEIKPLYAHFVEGRDFHIRKSYNCDVALDTKPFSFLRSAYATRLHFKEAGSMAHEALKLGMNSVYGKLAQQAGYRHGRIPSYHHLLWAGQITAATRASLYTVAMQHPESIVAFATDAIISRSQHRVREATGLGEWTPESFSGCTLVQAGVYWLRLPTGSWTDKYRGFDAGSIDRKEVVRCWDRGTAYKARLTRFYGMGSAIAMNDFTDHWRRWRTEERSLSLVPDGKRVPGTEKKYAKRLCMTKPAPNILGNAMSTPFPLAWGLLSGEKLRPVDDKGIDVRILEEEMMDSYA